MTDRRERLYNANQCLRQTLSGGAFNMKPVAHHGGAEGEGLQRRGGRFAIQSSRAHLWPRSLLHDPDCHGLASATRTPPSATHAALMVKDWSAATSMSPTRLSSSYPKAATPAACATMGSQGASQEEDSSTTSKEELLRSQLFVPSGTAIKASPSFLQQALGLVSGPRRTSCNRTPRRVAPNGTRPYDGAHKLREADGFLELLRVFEARSSAVLHARGVPQQETLHAISMRDATRR